GGLPPLEFDAARWLSDEDGFLAEIRAAAEEAGVRLYERDGVVFCYPVLVRAEPDLAAVRIDKRLDFNIRPSTLAAALKKAQAKDPKSKPERFIEALFQAYDFVRARKRIATWPDIALTEIYAVLTLTPGSDREYTLLDFARDVYYLDTSGVAATRKGLIGPSRRAYRRRVRSTGRSDYPDVPQR
ncbi:MAG TPA: hypothetical protein VGM37_11355, partial [Armatimonadota bacterium]